jgi:hypothetical protein
VGVVPVFVSTLSGYDSARKAADIEGAAEFRVWGPFALRGGAVYSSDTGTLRPQVGARAQFLTQARFGVDAAVGVFYKAEGFTEPEGEIETTLAFGRTMGRWSAYANLVYGQDPDGLERDGEVRASALYVPRENVVTGIDTRMRFDLGSNAAKRAKEKEADWDLVAGPTAGIALGRFLVSGQVGLSLVRLTQTTQAGAIALGGVGAVF